MKELTKDALVKIFNQMDEVLLGKKVKQAKIVLLGASSILMLDIRERGTSDIDIAPSFDAGLFKAEANKQGFDVDIVTVSTTVDFENAQVHEVYLGKVLTVLSVNELDLIKLKLERFRKQDPADIDAIIKKYNVSYEVFKKIAREALLDYVGNQKDLFYRFYGLFEELVEFMFEELKASH